MFHVEQEGDIMSKNLIYTARASIDADGAGLDEETISLPTDPTSNIVAELVRVEVSVHGSLGIATDEYLHAGVSRTSISGVAYNIADDNVLCGLGFRTMIATEGAVLLPQVSTYDFIPRVALVAAASINIFAYSSSANPNYHFRMFYKLTRVNSQELVALLS